MFGSVVVCSILSLVISYYEEIVLFITFLQNVPYY